MDIIDKTILTSIQKGFPLAEEPFKLLSAKFNISEDELILRLKRLRDQDKVLRNICAIFDGSKLGYKSVLVAMQIDNRKKAYLISYINKLPGVSHNYERNNTYNIWFTLSLEETINIDEFICNLSKQYSVNKFLILPSVKTYKLRVNFDLIESETHIETITENVSKTDYEYSLDEQDKAIIKHLQEDILLISRPFDQMADSVKLNTSQFIDRANYYIDTGIMRRYSATLRHINAGYANNAMIVWQVSENQIDKVGYQFAQKAFVSHCYRRLKHFEWPYDLYTMVHARSESDLHSYIDELYNIVNHKDYLILATLIEHKKERVKYFVG
ncbi:MAG: hypothetical protein AB1782_09955 [Cyanobacteriota bacterium]